MRKALQQYNNVSIESDIASASPYRITQMLFEGCLKFLRIAKQSIAQKNYERKAEYIAKSQAIISALAASVNKDVNAQLSDNLIDLYVFCEDKLIDASINMDESSVDVVIKIIGSIKSGWDAIPAEEVEKAEISRRNSF